MKLNLEVDFDAFTIAIVEKLKAQYEAEPNAKIVQLVPFEDMERSIKTIGAAAAGMKSLNPIAFDIALNHYAECLKAVVLDAQKEVKDDDTSNP